MQSNFVFATSRFHQPHAEGNHEMAEVPSEKYSLARDFHRTLNETQWFTPEKLLLGQQQNLAQLVRHAYRTTPFYKKRLAPLVHPNGDVDLSDWNKVPFLTRRDIQDSFQTLQSAEFSKIQGVALPVTSSGSTAEPITALTSTLASVSSLVATVRGLEWFDIRYDLVQAQIKDNTPGKSLFPGERMDSFWSPYWYDNNSSGEWHKLNANTPHHQQLEWLSRLDRCYLNILPSSVKALAFAASSDPSFTPDIEAVITVGEGVNDELREIVRTHLHCEIIDSYSMKECGTLACQCPVSGNYHITSETACIEIVDDAGEPCEVGQTGHVIVTPFYNHVMPLIRYRTGDLAAWAEPCKCGRGLKSMSAVSGREATMFRFPGGITIPPLFTTVSFLETLGARQWQVAQTADDVVEIRFVSDWGKDRQNRNSLVKVAHDMFGDHIEIEFKQMKEIPLTASGKHMESVCELLSDDSRQSGSNPC